MPSYKNWNSKYENLGSAELQKKYDAERAEYKEQMNGLLDEAASSLTAYSAQQLTPYTKRIIEILQNRIQQDKTCLAKNCTLSEKPNKTYGDMEFGITLRDAGFSVTKTQELINTFYKHANEENDIVSYYKEAKAREEHEQKEAGTYTPPQGNDPVIYTYSPDGLTVNGKPATNEGATDDKSKGSKDKEIVDPHDYPTDEYGNILGIEIYPKNKIGPNDSEATIAKKHDVQLKLLNYARNHGKGAGTYIGKSHKDYNQKKTYSEEELAALLDAKNRKSGAPTSPPRGVSLSSAYSKTYTTFSGEDMVVTVEIPVDEARGISVSRVVGQFQTISYSIHNEKTPVRNIGNMNARTYVFGPRTIAGSIVLTVFNRHWMKEMLAEYNQSAHIWNNYLVDELPPINITISAANEYGKNAKLSLYGVTFVNEGQVMSINDLYTENTYQFFAQDIDYLSPVWKSKSKKTNKSNLPVKSDDKSKTKDAVTQTKSSTPKTTVVGSDAGIDPPIISEFSDTDAYVEELKSWKDKNMALWDLAYTNKKCSEKQKTDGKQSVKRRYDALLKDTYARMKQESEAILP